MVDEHHKPLSRAAILILIRLLGVEFLFKCFTNLNGQLWMSTQSFHDIAQRVEIEVCVNECLMYKAGRGS